MRMLYSCICIKTIKLYLLLNSSENRLFVNTVLKEATEWPHRLSYHEEATDEFPQYMAASDAE